MAMETQGVQILRLSSTADVSTNRTIDITATAVAGVGASFVETGFSTGMFLIMSERSTDYYRIKSLAGVNSSIINIYGNFRTTGTTVADMWGYASTFIGEITDFTGPGGSGAVIDITSIQSTAREKMVGVRDEGQLSMTMNFNATDYGQTKLIADRAARKSNAYAILFTDRATSADSFPSWCWFRGTPMSFSVSGAVDNKVTANAVIEISGPVVYSTASTA
jgi:hypothetical protein